MADATAAATFADQHDALVEARAAQHEANRIVDTLTLSLLTDNRGYIRAVNRDTPLHSGDDGTFGAGIGDIELVLDNGISIQLGSDARMSESLCDYLEHIEGHIESDVPDARLVGFLLGIDETIIERFLQHLQTYIEENMYDRVLVLA